MPQQLIRELIMKTNSYFLFLCACLFLLTLVAIFAPLLTPYDPYTINLAQKLAPSSFEHFLGTDHLGRDVFTRLLYGLRISLISVLIISSTILFFALIIGSIAGFKGGLVDSVLMRFCDVFLTFPTFVLALFFMGILGTGLTNVLITIALTHWAWYARMVRSMVLDLKNQPYIMTAKTLGSSDTKIILRHILPTVFAQILILSTLDFGHMLLHMAGLSFLGLGITAPTAEWGVMINDAMPFIRENPALMLYPGLCIFLIVALFNSFGELLRDKFDISQTYKHENTKSDFSENPEVFTESLACDTKNSDAKNYEEKTKEILLKVKDLNIISYPQKKIINNLNFNIHSGEVLVVLGESGSGKTMTSLALMDLLPHSVIQKSGEILFQTFDSSQKHALTPLPKNFRGESINIIMQSPASYFDNVFTIRTFLKDTLKSHKKYENNPLSDEILQSFLQKVGLNQTEETLNNHGKSMQDILNSYAFELSGGTLQRIMIALNLALDCPLLIADEILSDLDNKGQKDILELLLSIYKNNSKKSLLFITHDIGVAIKLADRIMVMQKGNNVDLFPVSELYSCKRHCYTKQLLSAHESLRENSWDMDFEKIDTCISNIPRESDL